MSTIALIYSLYTLISIFISYNESAQTYKKIEQIYYAENDSRKQTNVLLGINPNYMGWIKIDGTSINYPVVQSDNNNYYLTHNFYNESDFAGTIFMDYRNSLSQPNQNLILYGHNMKNGSMFGSLKNYLDSQYYSAHKKIQFKVQGNDQEWEIFSIYTTADTNWMEHNYSGKKMAGIIRQLWKKSKVRTSIQIDGHDQLLTLATCTASDKKRFVVHALRVK